MREFQEQRRKKNTLLPKVGIVALSIILALVIRGVVGIYQKDQESRLELVQTQKQAAELASQSAQFQNDSVYLKTPEGIETEIRSKFDVSKQGEGVIVIVDRASGTPPADDRNFMLKIWDSIKGMFGAQANNSIINKNGL